MPGSSVVFLCLVIGLCYSGNYVDGQFIPPITQATSGFSNRAEYVSATITPQHITGGAAFRGTSATPRMGRWVRGVMGGPFDHAGHLIARRLGGTGAFEYNIIPQSSVVNVGAFRRLVENPIFNSVRAGNTVLYELWPSYAGRGATRPWRIQYRARIVGGAMIHPLNSIMNPPSPAPAG